MRAYIDQLRRAGQVREIAREVSGRHELAAMRFGAAAAGLHAAGRDHVDGQNAVEKE